MTDWYTTLTRRPDTTNPAGDLITPTGSGDGVAVTIADPDAYVAAALQRECDEVAATTEGGRNHRLNKAAYSLARLIAGGLPLNETTVRDQLTTAAANAGLDSRETHITIRSGLTSGAKQPLAWTRPATPPTATPFTGSPTAPTDDDTLALAVEVAKLRRAREAKRLLDAEQHAATFTAPQPRSLRDFLAEPDTAPTFLIADVLPYGSNATLTAQYKSGKTTTLANLIASLADQTPFLGVHPVTSTPGDVALFDYEMTETQLRRWLRDADIRNVDNVHVVPLRGRGLALDHPAGRQWAVNWLRDRQIGTWLVDPFARAYLGDENDNGAITTWTDALDVIKAEAGVHTLVMAVHTGRAALENTRARGATRLDDWPDVRWLFVKQGDTRYFAATGRDVEVPEAGLTYNPTTRKYTADLPGRKADALADDVEIVLEKLPALGENPASFNDFVKAMGVQKGKGTSARASRLLDQMRNDRLVHIEMRGNTYRIWRLKAIGVDLDT